MKRYKSVLAGKEESSTSSKKGKRKVRSDKGKKRRSNPNNEALQAQRLAEREAKMAEREAELARRKALLERQQHEAVAELQAAIEKRRALSDGERISSVELLPPRLYPVFRAGQKVKATYFGITRMGRVVYDNNPTSAMVRVLWDDGSNQFAAKANLVLVQKRTYTHVFFKPARKSSKRVPSGNPRRGKRSKRASKKA